MGYAGTLAADVDRLPWLKDDRKPARAGETPALIGWGVAGLLTVAAASFWAGQERARPADGEEIPSATLRLPQPIRSEPATEAAPQSEVVAEAPPAPVETVAAKPAKPTINRIVANPAEPADRSAAAETDGEEGAEDEEKVAEKPLTYWPASESAGAAGRIVRVGTFNSRLQAKRAWWKVVKVYPGMQGLKAVVHAIPSMRNGRTYYRLQFGTTSQAHSEILCQRMKIVGQSCVVVGVGEAQNQGG